MKLLEQGAPTHSESQKPPEVIIPEARRRRRRRRLRWVAVGLVIAAGSVALGLELSAATPRPHHGTGRSVGHRSAPPASLSFVSPKRPAALAVAPNGDLYLIDSVRDQILRLLPSGKFVVVAGNGRTGNSGNGGLATKAELRLAPHSGLVFSQNDTLYFSDSGNDEVRAVLPDGRIETVAGGGRLPLPSTVGTSVPARSAHLGTPAGLAIGPNHELYIAAGFIVRFSQRGRLFWVAGAGASKEGLQCWTPGCQVGEGHFGSASGLAFDSQGNLVVSSDDFPGWAFAIGEIRKNGAPVLIGGCRGTGGQPCAVASAADGSVIAGGSGRFYRINAGAEREHEVLVGAVVKLSHALAVVAVGDSALEAMFLNGTGIAVASNGTIYTDTEPNATGTPYSVLELTTAGRVRVLWFNDWWKTTSS
jgi:hypothetical protein